jgi:Bacteriophage T4-like portal protein (Gp20)
MADTSIFGRLRRLFSTNTVVRNVGGKRLKVADTDNTQSFVNRRGIDRYHRVYSSMTGGYGAAGGRYEAAAAFQGSRLQLFRDYDMMDNDPIISSVMDIYADESTVKDEFGQILSIRSKNDQIQEILHNLFYDILNVEFNLWPWVRNMAKYGDFFLFLDIDPEYGVVNAIPLSVYETIRVEGQDPENPFSVKFKIENDFLALGKKELDNYEIAHFRLLSDTNFLPYGKSMVEGGRRVWKQLQLMEDAMLIHRIMRAPDKRKILVDIGNIPPNEIDTHMQRIIDRMKKTPLVDPKTGDYNLRYNMMNITEDFYLPVRGKDSGTDITNLPGLQFNAIEDIEYLRNKLMAAFKVPKSFLGYEEDNSGKASLAAQDVRFARTIERIQRIIVSELTKIAIIHLYVQGFTDEELIDFELEMTSPSVIYEQEKLNLWKEKIQLANDIANSKFLSREWIYHNILQIAPDDAKKEQDAVVKDVEWVGKADAAGQQAAQPEQPTGEPGTPEEVPAEEPAQEPMDDVDQILASLEQPAEDEEAASDEELEEAKMGRPRTGMAYGQDSHPRGRDPLGHKENMDVLKGRIPRRAPSKKSPLSLENSEISNLIKQLKQKNKESVSILSEENILDIDEKSTD